MSSSHLVNKYFHMVDDIYKLSSMIAHGIDYNLL